MAENLYNENVYKWGTMEFIHKKSFVRLLRLKINAILRNILMCQKTYIYILYIYIYI